jgi:hypothetical protein
MHRLAVNLILLAVAAGGLAQEPEIQPAFELTVVHLENVELSSVKLSPEQVQHFADDLNRNALFEGRVLRRLTKHRTGPENYLYEQIKRIRETAKTDPAKAETMINSVVEKFRKFGVEL